MSPPATALRCGRRCGPRARNTASRPMAPRRCTSCAPRRAISSSARTPTARSPPTMPGSAGRWARRSPISSAAARSRGPTCTCPIAKQLVGLLTEDADTVLEEGAQIVADPDAPIPMPMIGHVTSAYHSSTLGRSIALAVVAGGRARVGRDAVRADAGQDAPRDRDRHAVLRSRRNPARWLIR